MIDRMINLTTKNAGGNRRAEVDARADAKGAEETFTFVIKGKAFSTGAEIFAPNEEKTVSVTHDQNGKGLVSVSSTPSNQKAGPCDLDLDAAVDGC
ncbi:MAG: hypothetical protein ABSD56_05330 [Bryobacteraceae bacterium]